MAAENCSVKPLYARDAEAIILEAVRQRIRDLPPEIVELVVGRLAAAARRCSGLIVNPEAGRGPDTI